MDERAALRERGRWTKAAIVSMLAEEPGASRSAIARRLDVTAQAVSVQVQELLDADLLVDDGGLRPTAAGIAMLHGDADALQAAAQRLGAPLARMDTISARAARRIKEGQTVGLWMRDGDLVADPGDVGDSRGVAVAAAAAGDEVRVRAPEGIVAFEPGRIEVVRVPEALDGGIASIHVERPEGLVAAVGTGATILARRFGLDIPFAGAEGALNAAQRGLDVTLFVSADQFADAVRAIDAGNVGHRVEVRVQDAPNK